MPVWGQQQKESGSRSDVLKPLIWPLGLTLAAIPALLAAKAPTWMAAGLGIAFAIILLIYVVAFVALLLFKPDSLRSEHFVLTQTAMQHGLLGDSLSGRISTPLLANKVQKTAEPSNAGSADETEL